MGLRKGQTGNPSGRPKGSKNKATADLREAVLSLIDNNWYRVQEDLELLDAKDRLHFIERLLGYALPKLSSVELQAEVTGKIQGMSKDQLDKLIDQILNDTNQ